MFRKILKLSLYLYAFSTVFSSAAMAIASAIFTVLLVGYLITYKIKPISLFNKKIFIASLAWISVIIISLLTMKIRGVPLDYRFDDFKKIIYVINPFIVFLGFKVLNIDLKKFLKHFICMALPFAVIGIAQHFWGFDFWGLMKNRYQPIPGYHGFLHAVGTVGFHLSFSGIMLFHLFYSFAFLFNERDSGGNLRFFNLSKLIWLFSFLLITFTVYCSYSRIAWGAIPFVFMMLVFLKSKRIAIIVFSLIFAIGAILALTNNPIKNRFNDLNWQNERGIVWEASFLMFKDYPVLGVGWQKNSEITRKYQIEHNLVKKYDHVFEFHAHNVFLNVLSMTGIVGILVFSYYLFCLFMMIVKIKRRDDILYFAFLGAFLAFMFSGLTQWNYGDVKVAHSFIFLIAMIMYAEVTEREQIK